MLAPSRVLRGRTLRVLYAVSEYPYVNGSYIEAEVRGVAAAGVDVHVWSRNPDNEAPHPLVVPLHAGLPLADCIERVRPYIVHTHYLTFARIMAPEVAACGIPYTVRVHGFEYRPDLLNAMAADPAIARIFVYPHLAGDVEPRNRGKVSVLPIMYNPEFYGPDRAPDPRLVLRAAAGLSTKNIEYFLETAKLCPEHRFVLVLGRTYAFNREPTARIQALNARMGHPVEIRINLDWPAMARLMRAAAIYMYTPPVHRPGMPISVAEAMATGCLVLAPDIEGMRGYLGASGGRLYRTPAEAAEIVRATAAWGPREWRAVERRAAAFAARHYSSRVLAPRLVAAWRRVLRERKAAPPLGVFALWRRLAGRARAAA